MKKIIAVLFLAASLTVLSACGGISDVVDGTTPSGNPAETTPVVTDPVRDSYYEDLEEIRVFDNVYLEITYGGKIYTITDTDTASTILFAITAVQLTKTDKPAENTMQIRVYRNGAAEYEVQYPYVEVTDPDSGKAMTYYASINDWSADAAILDVLRVDGVIR